MENKAFYEDPAVEVLRFRISDILATSDPDYNEDDYIELPIDPA